MEVIQSKQQSFKSTRRYGNNRVMVYSPKLNQRLEFHSTLEYLCFLNLEFLGHRSNFIPQPDIDIHFEIDGKIRRSRPDFLVITKEGKKTIIECKYSFELEKEKVKQQVLIQKEWAKINGYEHQLFTEHDAKRIQMKLTSHMKLLGSLVRANDNTIMKLDNHENELTMFLSTKEIVTIEQLKNQLNWLNDTNCLAAIGYYYHKGILNLLLDDKPLSYETEVTINAR